MFAEHGWLVWLALALGWVVAGLCLAWFFGRFADAGEGKTREDEAPAADRPHADRGENGSAPPAPGAAAFDRPAKLG